MPDHESLFSYQELLEGGFYLSQPFQAVAHRLCSVGYL
jgi:hypothetical protein